MVQLHEPSNILLWAEALYVSRLVLSNLHIFAIAFSSRKYLPTVSTRETSYVIDERTLNKRCIVDQLHWYLTINLFQQLVTHSMTFWKKFSIKFVISINAPRCAISIFFFLNARREDLIIHLPTMKSWKIRVLINSRDRRDDVPVRMVSKARSFTFKRNFPRHQSDKRRNSIARGRFVELSTFIENAWHSVSNFLRYAGLNPRGGSSRKQADPKRNKKVSKFRGALKVSSLLLIGSKRVASRRPRS